MSKEYKVKFKNEKKVSRKEAFGYKTFDENIDNAKTARNTQRNDTNPMIQKEGFLGMDDLDKMRRRKIGKMF